MSVTRRTVLTGALLATEMTAAWAAPARNLTGSARSIIDEMVRQYGFQGVVVIGRDGLPRFSHAVGSADIERQIAVAVETPFGIASISKRLTAVAVMRLVERGRLALDQPITAYLPDYRPDTGARVTLRHLLSNSSGVPNLFRTALRADRSLMATEMSAREAIRRFASGDLAFEPGTRFDYTPTNWFIVLGIIEAVTGTPFAQAMRALVIEPLELVATTLDPSPRTAKSYRSVSPSIEWLDSRPAYRAASGGYFSTARDLLRFAHRVYDTGFLSRASRLALTRLEVASDSYALGGRIRQVPVEGTTVAAAWETGNLAGYRSVLGHRLDGQGEVVILNNTAMLQRTMDEFAEALLRLG
ncbi:serine hydrolase domain-containing protein [Sphingosinicella sp. LHD-64]|uniref:serine hydrolase domain-containing protein n=1 Tax=Sphingosinicella sp. LHD-64 TaxID=3072139 RepID=UPI00280F1350|nr:serine hydrolase domain-containing protein [Sphingosinicella sp. LHD-64]MDQ8756226.1 serine hydrolase domain-containing protein [Sphingosinicella sp. LHD-64]